MAIYLLNKMREAGKEVDAVARNLNCLAASIGAAFSPIIQLTLGIINKLVATLRVNPSALELLAAIAGVVQSVSKGL